MGRRVAGGWRGRWRARRAPTAAERGLLAAAGADEAASLVLTQSRVDVGHWLGRGRIWAACLPDALLLVAAGTRSHVERVPFGQLGMTVYNPMTGELVLLPAPEVRQRSLRLAPADGWRLLEQIKQKESSHA